jgi:hypothetical protein
VSGQKPAGADLVRRCSAALELPEDCFPEVRTEGICEAVRTDGALRNRLYRRFDEGRPSRGQGRWFEAGTAQRQEPRIGGLSFPGLRRLRAWPALPSCRPHPVVPVSALLDELGMHGMNAYSEVKNVFLSTEG